MKPNKQAYIDFILSELNKGNVERNVVMANFGKKWQLGNRTFDRYWEVANEAHREQFEAINSAKLEQRIESEKEAVKRDIISKHEALEILTKIAKGTAKRVEGQVIMPSPGEQRQSIETMAKIEGWFAPKEIETTDKTIQPLQFEIIKREDTTT
jgi:hypothetical protein